MAQLADIGLVSSIDASRSLVGTDGYIAPEGPGTARADLYSLGKVLYECATGKDRAPADYASDIIGTAHQRFYRVAAVAVT